MPSKWFAVKTLYRSCALGRPEKPDLMYDPDATSVEERTVLIKAKDRADAIHKAQREAKDYAQKGSCINPYNQKVVTSYMGHFDIHEIQGNLADKIEIFSTARLLSKKIKDAQVARIYIGKKNISYGKGKKKKFINRDYTGS